jgi:hypothetical protein
MSAFHWLLLRLTIGLVVVWVIARMARPLARWIQEGSRAGLIVGGLAGGSLGVAAVLLLTREATPERRHYVGPGMIAGCLLGIAAGGAIRPKRAGETPPRSPADLADDLVDTDPRWSEAVDRLGRFQSARDRVAAATRKGRPRPPEPDEDRPV